MITSGDLVRLMEDFRAAPDDMKDTLEVWGIDPDGFSDLWVGYIQSAMATYVSRECDLDETIGTAFVCAFILGYKTAMEVETRREVDGNEVQGT